jgi:hypothetical protein
VKEIGGRTLVPVVLSKRYFTPQGLVSVRRSGRYLYIKTCRQYKIIEWSADEYKIEF